MLCRTSPPTNEGSVSPRGKDVRGDETNEKVLTTDQGTDASNQGNEKGQLGFKRPS